MEHLKHKTAETDKAGPIEDDKVVKLLESLRDLNSCPLIADKPCSARPQAITYHIQFTSLHLPPANSNIRDRNAWELSQHGLFDVKYPAF